MPPKREPNLLESEKKILISLVEAKMNIIECKKTDALTANAKSEEWERLAAEFNNLSSFRYRSAQFLKTSWENYKKRMRQDIAKRKRETLATGGGPPDKVMVNENMVGERLMSALLPSVSGLNNPWDGDSRFGSTVSSLELLDDPEEGENQEGNSTSLDQNFTEEADTEEPAIPPPAHHDWRKYTPQMLRQPLSAALLPSPRVPVTVRNPLREITSTVTGESQEGHTGRIQDSSPTAQRGSSSAATIAVSSPQALGRNSQGCVSRRRPSYAMTHADAYYAAKKNLVEQEAEQSREAHAINIKIMQEKAKQEELRTKQEQRKLDLMEIQLQQKTTSSQELFVFGSQGNVTYTP